MKRGRKPSTKNDVSAGDNNSKAKKIKPAEDVKSSDAQDKIASLPLHGEYLPAKGYSVVPPLVNEMRQALVEVFQMVRNQKRLGDKVRTFAVQFHMIMCYHVMRRLQHQT